MLSWYPGFNVFSWMTLGLHNQFVPNCLVLTSLNGAVLDLKNNNQQQQDCQCSQLSQVIKEEQEVRVKAEKTKSNYHW